MSGSIKFFQYAMRPRDNILNTMTSAEIAMKKQEKLSQYEKIYRDGFCKAYGIECKDRDVESFLYLVNKHILSRHNPEGVDYRPTGSMVRIFIAPYTASINVGVTSHDIKNDYEKEFNKFKELILKNTKKPDNLESKLK